MMVNIERESPAGKGNMNGEREAITKVNFHKVFDKGKGSGSTQLAMYTKVTLLIF
jgi:hypothetical protein